MEENNKNSSRLFYITLAVIITVVAVLIITASVSKKSDIPVTPDNTTETPTTGPSDTPTDSNTDTLPTFSLPVNGVINYDYSDSVPVFSQTMGDYRTHLGVDVSAELGSKVMAVADGTVTNIWNDPFMGTCVSIQHSGNAVSIYKNLAPEVAEGLVVGCTVKGGDTIGAVGETAMNEIAEEPHLHYELKINDTHVDPKDHFNFPTADTNYEDEKAE
ncbi:MAG: M23 family metallopeptidase [Clostridia bacterium]|nr:M23 family metallopeptidase [Clostridia bacterium]